MMDRVGTDGFVLNDRVPGPDPVRHAHPATSLSLLPSAPGGTVRFAAGVVGRIWVCGVHEACVSHAELLHAAHK